LSIPRKRESREPPRLKPGTADSRLPWNAELHGFGGKRECWGDWRVRRGSNSQPSVPKTDALSN
jgi:hypothetical protein